MAKDITEEEIRHLGTLARINIADHDIARLARDLSAIVAHVDELQNADTAGVSPATGGTKLKNIFREDTERNNTLKQKGVETFPEVQNGLLKVPPVFE